MKNILVKGFFYLCTVFGLVFLAIFPKNKYEWMQQLDPTLSTLPQDDGAGGRFIVATLVLLLVFALQGFFLLRAKTIFNRLLPAFLLSSALLLWFSRWY